MPHIKLVIYIYIPYPDCPQDIPSNNPINLAHIVCRVLDQPSDTLRGPETPGSCQWLVRFVRLFSHGGHGEKVNIKLYVILVKLAQCHKPAKKNGLKNPTHQNGESLGMV